MEDWPWVRPGVYPPSFRIRDYAATLDFEGRRYVEIPNREAFWVDANWGGPGRNSAARYHYRPDWPRLGFGRIPACAHGHAKAGGIKALREMPALPDSPAIRVGDGSLTIRGTMATDQWLEHAGGDAAAVVFLSPGNLAGGPCQLRAAAPACHEDCV